MKFLADEHIDTSAVDALKKIGIDISSVQELGMRGENDENLLTYAKENETVIITRDSDFLSLHTKGKEHAGILFISKPLSIGNTIREIEKVHLLFEPEHLRNRVIFIPLKINK
ncbi:MAG: DUF5615 family PIN-like protein [Archaeoglobaceae archaeon]